METLLSDCVSTLDSIDTGQTASCQSVVEFRRTMQLIVRSGGAECAITREELWSAICAVEPEALATEHFSPSGVGKMCVGEIGAVAALRLVLLDQARCAQVLTHTATQLYCANADVAPMTAVGRYTVGQFIFALQVLRALCTTCCYSQRLVNYCFALECRAAQLLLYEWQGSVHTLLDLRAPSTTPGMFRPNRDMQTIVWTTFCGLNRKLIRAPADVQFVEAAPQPLTPAQLRVLGAMRDWMLHKCAQLSTESCASSLAACYSTLSLQPGDRELSRFMNKDPVSSSLYVCARIKDGPEIEKINVMRGLSVKDVLEQQLPAYKLGEPDSLEAGLCLYELLDVLSRSIGCQDADAFASRFCAPEPVFRERMDDVLQFSLYYPMLVQVFNHWQVLYQRKVYVTNSFFKALYLFLNTCEADVLGGAAAAALSAAEVQNHPHLQVVRQTLSPDHPCGELFAVIKAADE
jgi:hypothetical protein